MVLFSDFLIKKRSSVGQTTPWFASCKNTYTALPISVFKYSRSRDAFQCLKNLTTRACVAASVKKCKPSLFSSSLVAKTGVMVPGVYSGNRGNLEWEERHACFVKKALERCRVFSGTVSPRILSLESVDYFEEVNTSVVQKKRRIFTSKTLMVRQTTKSKSPC